MSSEDISLPKGQLQAISKRVFSRSNDSAPDPIYINAIEFIALGMDVFMDAGIVSPESIAAAMGKKDAEGVPMVDFIVNYRFGMSLQTAALLQQRLTEMLQRAGAQAAAMMDETKPQAMKKEG